MPAVISMEFPVGTMKMRAPVTPDGAAAEQAAVGGLLALVSPPLVGRSWDPVMFPGSAAKQAVAPAMLLAAELPV